VKLHRRHLSNIYSKNYSRKNEQTTEALSWIYQNLKVNIEQLKTQKKMSKKKNYAKLKYFCLGLKKEKLYRKIKTLLNKQLA
jgi:hypothetical protein